LEKRKKVAVDEDYLVFLHDLFAENQAMMSEILGSGADVIRSYGADRLVKTLEKTQTFHPIDGVVQKLKSWGIGVDVETHGYTIGVEVKCPHAEKVHPRLSSAKPVCPLTEYVLGAIRLENREAQMEHSVLLQDGAKLVVRTRPK
jgi:biotin operon repressor